MSSKSSTTETPDSQDILVGLIHKPHGLRGEVAVEALSDVEGRFAVGARLVLSVPGVPRRVVSVRSCRAHGRGLLLVFEGVATREAAEQLRGGRLEVERDRVPPAGEGEFYHFELVGCQCYDAGRDLGVVIAVIEDGGGSILRVRDGEAELLLPFVQEFLAEIDTEGRRIDVDLPDGLVEACRSKS